ncbi:hypothetical protein CYMTET_29274 [Cymbomonas tetramitiformis]|uniref:protein-serine/threonine phosphatase n=1 Tax=Cymbomonas tetramitiformis TaxID=36881 RepID=A0AAE0FLK6_9CHLO|nr:hypothetical protein CYMTET_29274 [Cymbomonas tetramitiformis]
MCRGRDESASCGTLPIVLQLLVRIWHRAQTCLSMKMDMVPSSSPVPEPMVDLRYCLAEEKKQVLLGCKIVFSGALQERRQKWQGRDMDKRAAVEARKQLWALAVALGAECCTETNDAITHVVSSEKRSAKVKWGIDKNIPCVTPAWIHASATQWVRANEERYLLG